MGISSDKESFLKNKIFWSCFGLIVTGLIMRFLSPPHKLDVRYWYSIIEAKEFLYNLTPDQAKLYFFGELFDFLFMINYSWLLYLILKKKYVFLLGILDFCETFLIIVFLVKNQFLEIMNLLPIFSSLKWATAVLMLTLILLHLVKRHRQ